MRKLVVISLLSTVLFVHATDALSDETIVSISDAMECNDGALDPKFGSELMSDQSSRIFTDGNVRWSADVVLPADADQLEVKEEKRDSVLLKNFAILRQIIVKVSGIKTTSSFQRLCATVVQKYPRSTFTLTPRNSKDKSRNFGSKTYVVGPQEHWYISADMGVTNLKQLTWDQKSNSAVQKSTPSSFYLGFNYKLGDVVDGSKNSWYEDIIIKPVMIKASASPFDSFGFGIAYEFKWLTVFGARVWTKDDPSVGGVSTGRTPSIIYGASFNIEKGLDWLKN